MNDPTPIPSEYRTLIGLLRCAVHRKPPEGDLLAAADWPATLRLARQHGVDTYLYPWLAEHAPALFSPHADVPPDSAPAAWRALFLEAVPRTLLRQRQLAELLDAFARARIDVIPLKGAWLSETLYDDPVRRTMSDLDVLVRESDCDRCHTIFLGLGYLAERDVRHNPYACDQTYFHPSRPWPVELHWNVASAIDTTLVNPDLNQIWLRAVTATHLAYPAYTLACDDQLAHLVQHLLHHKFAMPLRGYVDLALFLAHYGHRMTGESTRAAADRWRIGCAIPFVADLVARLFDLPRPSWVVEPGRDALREAIEPLIQTLFRLPPSVLMAGEATLIHLKTASLFGRLSVLTRRIFMPRDYLAFRYPFARHTLGVPLAWIFRVRDLWIQRGRRKRALAEYGISSKDNLEDYETRAAWVLRLVAGNKKSG